MAIYVLVDRNNDIVDKVDMSDVGLNGAKTYFVRRKQIDVEVFDKLWKVKSEKEYDLNKFAFERKASSDWWEGEENYLDIDKP